MTAGAQEARHCTSMKSVVVRIPGSTSNLGPGFDTLGLAFNLYHEVRVTLRRKRDVQFSPPIKPEYLPGALSMVTEAANGFFARTRAEPFGIDVGVRGDVPVARGLGFSAIVRLGVVAGLSELTGASWDKQMLLDAVTDLEGHPDNASPAIYGGFTVSSRLASGVRCLRFPVTEQAWFVVLVPPFGLPTKEARKVIPDTFTRADTMHNLNRSALISAAFASGNLEALRGCFEDRVHEPYRERLIPALSRVLRAGEEAGAIGGWLSGAGSAIVCLALEHKERIAEAMQRELPNSSTLFLKADNEGFAVQSQVARDQWPSALFGAQPETTE